MKRCCKIPKSGTLVGLICSGLLLVGCSSSDSDPLMGGAASQLNDGAPITDQMSLSDTVNRLSSVMVDRSRSVLQNLNMQISVSGVPAQLSDCLSANDFPVLEYFCGSEGEGVRLSEFGYPVHEFSFTENDACEAALINTQDASECVVEVAEAELGQDWFVRYRFISEQDNTGVTTLQVSKGFFSSINDPSFATDICVVTLLGSEIVSYNDVVYCDSVLRDVAEIAENS